VQVGTGTPVCVCNGAAGPGGDAGTPGESAVVMAVSTAGESGNCVDVGGVKVQVGSGTPVYVCNGAADLGPLWQRCASDGGTRECAPPGATCATPSRLYAYSWFKPNHWPNDLPPNGSTFFGGEEVALHQSADPKCDWRQNNSNPSCHIWGGVAKDLDELATRLLQRPAGHRALIWRSWANETLPHLSPVDQTVPGASREPAQWGIWWDAGANEYATTSYALFNGLKQRGVTLDWLFIDIEFGLGNWGLGTCDAADPAVRDVERSRWRAIAEDPRMASVLDEWGKRFGADLTVPLAHQLCPMAYGTERYLQWNAFMYERTAGYYTRALVEPAKQVFPHLKASNYDYGYASPRHQTVDLNGHATMRYGTGAIVGSHQSPPCYGILGQVSTIVVPTISATQPYARTPFNSFRFAINEYRARAVARPDVPMAPWIAQPDYTEGGLAALGGTSLWSELLLHLGASGPEALIYWNNSPTRPTSNDATFEQALDEVNRVTGCGGKQPQQTELADWTAPWVVSGMKVEGRAVWRFTPESATTTLVRVGDALEATSGGKTLVFPEAWEVPSTAGLGRGRWILQGASAPAPFVR